MKEMILKALTFLRVIDEHDGKISLTNIAVIIILTKLCFIQSASMVDIGALFIALMNYAGKKVMYQKEVKVEQASITEIENKISEMEGSISALNISSSLKKLN